MRQEERLDVKSPLPAKIEEAARIEAMEGLTITAIAERVGMRRETISLYRNHHPQYMVARAAAAKEVLEPFMINLDLARAESVDVLRNAVERIKALLNYEVDGLPVPSVQLEAARIAVTSPVIRSVLGGLDEAGAKAHASAAAAVVIRYEGTPEQLAAMAEVIKIEDGEIVP